MEKSVLVIDTPESCWMCPIATDHSASEVSVTRTQRDKRNIPLGRSFAKF